jgi:hypothetical protein
MPRRFHLLACLALTGFAACKGCEDRKEAPAAAAPERSEQSQRARVLSRMSGRKLDRSKVYPKDGYGVVQCATDIDCFILQAEGCTPAALDHRQTVSGYGITQEVRARYRITGSEVGRCKLEREVQSIDARLDPAMVEAFHKRGKTDEDVNTLRAEAIESLRGRNPSRLECFLTNDQVLEAALNLAEGRYNPVHWKTACRELAGKPPTIGSGEPPAQTAPAAPAANEGATPPKAAPAAPAAPAEPRKADVPVPKQP